MNPTLHVCLVYIVFFTLFAASFVTFVTIDTSYDMGLFRFLSKPGIWILFGLVIELFWFQVILFVFCWFTEICAKFFAPNWYWKKRAELEIRYNRRIHKQIVFRRQVNDLVEHMKREEKGIINENFLI